MPRTRGQCGDCRTQTAKKSRKNRGEASVIRLSRASDGREKGHATEPPSTTAAHPLARTSLLRIAHEVVWMKLRIKPRQENHKWSLYWKCSMATHTFTLDPFDIEVDPAVMTAMQLRRKLAETIGMRPEDELCRLESFVEPWELW